MADSWKAVAEALAERMQYQAYNCPVGSGFVPDGRGGMTDHGDEKHDPKKAAADCPFCADTIAYERYLKKATG